MEHKSQPIRSAKYIRYFNSFKLVDAEEHQTRSEAVRFKYLSSEEPVLNTSIKPITINI